MRKIIAALQTTLDGYIEGPRGELDWIENWEDPYDLMGRVDACILGRGMYPGYEEYWGALLADPTRPLPFTGKVATKGEVDYARFAERTPHIVLSRTLDKTNWKNTRIVRDVEAIRRLKQESGKDMYAVGGAALVGSLMNTGLVDEIQIVVQPIVLGDGKALFKDVKERHRLKLTEAKRLHAGMVRLTYSIPS